MRMTPTMKTRNKMIKQIMIIKYVKTNIFCSKDIQTKVKEQAIKLAFSSRCPWDTMWCNKFMSTDNRIKFDTSIRHETTVKNNGNENL